MHQAQKLNLDRFGRLLHVGQDLRFEGENREQVHAWVGGSAFTGNKISGRARRPGPFAMPLGNNNRSEPGTADATHHSQ